MAYWDIGYRHIVDVDGQLLATDADVIDAASLLATSAFWYAFVVWRDRPAVSRYATLGALVGFASLMRWQDGILFVVIGLDLLWRAANRIPLTKVVPWGLIAVAVGLIVFIPQMIVWRARKEGM